MKKALLLLACLSIMLSALSFPSAAEEETPLPIPVLMYHHIAEMTEYNTMTVSPQRFREDMIFLRDSGFTPLLPEDVARIAAGEMELPLRPVMITFDDGYESNYTHAFPILQETGMKATIALIVQSVRPMAEKPMWTMTWAQCREMYASGLVVFGSHTFNLHNPNNGGSYRQGGPNGIQRLAGESQEAYNQRVGADLYRSISVIKSYLGYSATYFAYPFGVTDPWFYSLLERYGITMTVTTQTQVADLSAGTLDMPRIRVDMSAPLSQLLADYSALAEQGITSYVTATLGGKAIYLPSILIAGQHYVHLSGVAGLLAKTPAAFTFDDNLMIERRSYRGKWSMEITPGNTVHVEIARRTLTFEDSSCEIIGLWDGGSSLFRLEDLAPLLGFPCVPTLTPDQIEQTPAVYAITFP